MFVFVVCGAEEHIAALHFSIKALKRFSRKSIIVVTDSCRNEVPVNHDNIIDVKTDKHFTHHQASIFLKTNLHKILPDDADYCYLDSDVVAINNQVDLIFNSFSEPITFSQDYCSIDEFSPFAINCNCLRRFKKENALFLNFSDLYEQTVGKEYKAVLEEINAATENNNSSRISQIANRLKYSSSKIFYRLNDKYKLNKNTGKWMNSADEEIDQKYLKENYIEATTGFIWNEKENTFLTEDGFSVTQLRCAHLRQQINSEFGLEINYQNWRHWNGGVFLFNRHSHRFMDLWHNATLKIFQNPDWKTRDQGTLAATVWKLGLQNHKTLDKEYNFIVDYNSKDLKYLSDLSFQDNGIVYKPFFLHIFHHFGDSNWPVWKDLEKHISYFRKEF